MMLATRSKRILAMIVAMIMCLSTLPVSVFADENVEAIQVTMSDGVRERFEDIQQFASIPWIHVENTKSIKGYYEMGENGWNDNSYHATASDVTGITLGGTIASPKLYFSMDQDNGEYAQIEVSYGTTEMFGREYYTLFLHCQLVSERDGETPPPAETQPVYVYAEAKEGQGTINPHDYFTIGKIEVEIPAATAADTENGAERYNQYKDAIATALDSIERYESNAKLSLADVDWTSLHAADGADDYVESGTMTWHLDGKIKDDVQLYYVSYDANGGIGTVPEDDKGYMAGQEFPVKEGSDLEREGYTFLGWSTNSKAVQPDESFTIPDEGGNVILYAVWRANDPQPVKETVNFYVSLDGSVYDYLDADGNLVVASHPAENFSGSVGTSTVKNRDHNATLAGKADEVTGTDTKISALAPNTIAEIPDDAAVFAALKNDSKMQAYCTANGINIDDITSENYDLYWYVLKYDESDGWHVDGVLVKKGESPVPAVDYKIVHEYYTNGSRSGFTETSGTGKAGTTVSAADIDKITTYAGNTYSYTSASPESITLAADVSSTITLRYDRTTGGGGGGTTDYYKVTINYYDEDGNSIASSYTSPSIREGRDWDYSDKQLETITVGDVTYTFSYAEGDPLTGTNIRRDQVVNLYYGTEADLDDGDTPLSPGPDGEIDIDDGNTPMGDGTEIIDENEIPMGSLPQTGSSEAVNPFATAGFMALAASMAAAGLVLTRTKSGKREED